MKLTNKEAIANLNHIYGIVSPDIQRSLDLAIRALEERKQGEWIDTASGYKCSVCGEENDYAYDEYKHKFTDYFCPNCGADMRSEEETKDDG